MAHNSNLLAFITLSLALVLTAVHAHCSLRARCLSLAPETHFFNSSLTVLEYVAAGTNLTFPENDPTCNRSSQVVPVDLCRVGLSIPPSNRSSISFEMWLPENWKGRFLASGNGGIDGCECACERPTTIHCPSCRLNSRTDQLIKVSNTRILHMPQRTISPLLAQTTVTMAQLLSHFTKTPMLPLILLGDRALPWCLSLHFVSTICKCAPLWKCTNLAGRDRLHTITEAGKRLTTLFYERAAQKSNFLGCSLGGRQGIKAADMFPGDFDGIVAGSPALDFNNLQSWSELLPHHWSGKLFRLHFEVVVDQSDT